MAGQSRRERIASFYRGPQTFFEKVASSATQYGYVGDRVVPGAVVRVDLNGYSAWAADSAIGDRVLLLNSFFTAVVPELESRGGIYFRDEGDCIVGLFSPYFSGNNFTWISALDFAKAAVARRYGAKPFTAKAVIASGLDIAVFQKLVERGTDDWSAEGQPFVTAARIESAIPSKPQVFMLKDEFDDYYRSTAPMVAAGSVYHWYRHEDEEKLRVSGLAEANNGWVDVVRWEHIPAGRV